jgi:hypothetical protein
MKPVEINPGAFHRNTAKHDVSEFALPNPPPAGRSTIAVPGSSKNTVSGQSSVRREPSRDQGNKMSAHGQEKTAEAYADGIRERFPERVFRPASYNGTYNVDHPKYNEWISAFPSYDIAGNIVIGGTGGLSRIENPGLRISLLFSGATGLPKILYYEFERPQQGQLYAYGHAPTPIQDKAYGMLKDVADRTKLNPLPPPMGTRTTQFLLNRPGLGKPTGGCRPACARLPSPSRRWSRSTNVRVPSGVVLQWSARSPLRRCGKG